jgi:hypothetical protein
MAGRSGGWGKPSPGEVVAVRRKGPKQRTVTVGEVRSLLEMVPDEAPLLVGIRDRHHFATLLGELPVTGVAVLPSGAHRALVFDVDTVS